MPLYQYSDIDQQLVDERVAQFRDQTERFLRAELTDDEFRPLRLKNGLYLQLHAPMLRIAVPYGVLSSVQLRALGDIAERYDRGYGHFTTRQNLQLNWPTLESVPDILADLAKVQMHAIQTSGNCIRNITADQLAGVVANEVADPRPWCELLRQWSSLHPEFAWLPRKFKIAVTGCARDRAATQVHDIGLQLVRNRAGELGFEVLVGGGLGRTPVIGKCIRTFLQPTELLRYLEAIMRVYNQYGRRDNKYKARIKILVNALGIDQFRERVDAEYADICTEVGSLDLAHLDRCAQYFVDPPGLPLEDIDPSADPAAESAFGHWYRRNTCEHRQPGYRVVYLSLKAEGVAPGDVTSEQMRAIADLADDYSGSEVRTVHSQNLVFAHVEQRRLEALWEALVPLGLARPNINRASDIICCPGLDFCSLANAGTIDVSTEIDAVVEPLDFTHDLGDVRINISGCMNACGHHHVGHIGILGVDKKGEEWYQIQLGGSSSEHASLGKVLGPAVARNQIAASVGDLLETYVQVREPEESLLSTVRRLGVEPFKAALYNRQ